MFLLTNVRISSRSEVGWSMLTIVEPSGICSASEGDGAWTLQITSAFAYKAVRSGATLAPLSVYASSD